MLTMWPLGGGGARARVRGKVHRTQQVERRSKSCPLLRWVQGCVLERRGGRPASGERGEGKRGAPHLFRAIMPLTAAFVSATTPKKLVSIICRMSWCAVGMERRVGAIMLDGGACVKEEGGGETLNPRLAHSPGVVTQDNTRSCPGAAVRYPKTGQTQLNGARRSPAAHVEVLRVHGRHAQRQARVVHQDVNLAGDDLR